MSRIVIVILIYHRHKRMYKVLRVVNRVKEEMLKDQGDDGRLVCETELAK
jgi:hypothetical protein